MAKINGIAHIALTVSNIGISKPFYRRLFKTFEMKIVQDQEDSLYGVGGRTGIVIKQCPPTTKENIFNQFNPGLHHLCFRAHSRADVDQIYSLAKELSANIIHSPRQDGFAPGYYSVLFEDPDGIRIEANHIPGKGILAPGLNDIGQKDTLWEQHP